MKNELKKLLKSNSGVGLAMTIFAAAAMITGTVFVYKSGAFQNRESLDTKQRQIVARTVQDIKSILADKTQCTTAMNLASPFSTIGKYTAGTNLESKVNLTNIEVAQNAREYNLKVSFTKFNELSKNGSSQTAFIKAKILQTHTTPISNYCISFETTGAEEGYRLFCENTGGTYDLVNGICDYDSSGNGLVDGDFRNRLINYACEVLGASASGTMCDGVNIAGTIHSQTYLDKSPKIDLGANSRTGFQDYSCPVGQISTGFAQNGQLNCSTLNCNSITASNSGVYSNYTLDTSLEGSQGKLVCKCERDFKFKRNVNGSNTAPASPIADSGGGDNMPASFGCGEPDPNACFDYDYDDGCGTGTSCRILRGKYPGCSQTTTSNQEILINSCGDVCAIGPGCTVGGTCTVTPLPPPTTSCSAGTVSGCVLPISGANTSGVNGKCSVNSTVTCTADCNSTGSWTNINNSSCSPKVNGNCGSTKKSCTTGQFSDLTDTATDYLWKCLGQSGGADVSCSIPKPPATGCKSGETEYSTMSACTSSATGCYSVSGGSSFTWLARGNVASTDTCKTSNGASCGGMPEKTGAAFPQKFGFVCDSSTVGTAKNCYHCGTGFIDRFDEVFDCKTSASTVYCGVPGVPVNGSCNNSTTNGCSAGALNDTPDDATNFLWQCTGSNGGTTASCSKPKTATSVAVECENWALTSGTSFTGWKPACMTTKGKAPAAHALTKFRFVGQPTNIEMTGVTIVSKKIDSNGSAPTVSITASINNKYEGTLNMPCQGYFKAYTVVARVSYKNTTTNTTGTKDFTGNSSCENGI